MIVDAMGCICKQLPLPYEEFEITGIPSQSVDDVILPAKEEGDICELKLKVICEFHKIIQKLECGDQPDLNEILEEISLIFMNQPIYNIVWNTI